MSDKGPISQVAEDVSEAIVKPVADEVGKAIEVGVKSVVNPQALDPAIQQQKKAQNDQKRIEAQRVISWYKKIDDEQKQIRMQKQQEAQAKMQEKTQESQVKQYKVVEKRKKEENIAVQNAKNKREIRGGVGG